MMMVALVMKKRKDLNEIDSTNRQFFYRIFVRLICIRLFKAGNVVCLPFLFPCRTDQGRNLMRTFLISSYTDFGKIPFTERRNSVILYKENFVLE